MNIQSPRDPMTRLLHEISSTGGTVRCADLLHQRLPDCPRAVQRRVRTGKATVNDVRRIELHLRAQSA